MTVIEIVQKLNTQINREFYYSNSYLHLSAWCAKHGLNGTATFLRNQAQSNVMQMMRVYNFMKQAGGMPVISEVETPNCKCDCLEALFLQMLDDCQQRRKTRANLEEEARNVNDSLVLAFLKSLDKEQIQDGQRLNMILDEVRSAKKAGLGLSQTDQHLLTLAECRWPGIFL